MAWAVDQATLGTNSSTGNSSTIALTTTNAVAANGWIYLVVGWFNASVTLTGVAGGSLTWSILAGNNSGVRAALVRAQAGAGGLASGTTITATFSGNTGERKIGAASFTGGDGTLQNNTTNSGSGTSWSVGSTVTGNALVVAAASLDTNGTSTADANSTELLDFVVGTASRSFLYYRIGGTPVGGTFSASAGWVAVGASFEDAAGGPTEHERSAAIAATGAVTVANREFFSVFERSAALAATGAVTVAHQRELLRQAALDATGAITISGARVVSRSASLDATGAITVTAHQRDHLRQAAVAATSSITTAGQRDLLRQAALAAASSITVAGEIGGAAVERSASLAATSSISATGQRDLLRSAAIAATGTIATAGQRDHVRQAALAATAAITASHQRELQRSALLEATGLITTAGQIGDIPPMLIHLTHREQQPDPYTEPAQATYRETAHLSAR